jgi:succinate dehydrogenase hydrophobic anchor subunit
MVSMLRRGRFWSGAETTVDKDKSTFDANILLRVLLCLFLGACLYLYITNNNLFANGAHNLQTPEAIVMFFVLGIPFVLALVHLWRSLRRHSGIQP